MALVITLLITAILVAVITEIIYSVHVHTSMTGFYKDSQNASLSAEGGVELASVGIPFLVSSDPLALTREDKSQVFTEGDGTLIITVEDERGKISLNSIAFSNGETNEVFYDIYTNLLYNLGLDVTLADTAADWIDFNDEPRAGGAETFDYYRRLPSPYEAKGGPFYTRDEVLLVKGYTPEVYTKLKPFITVYGDGLVNINTAPKEVIMALSAEISESMAETLIDYRTQTPFTDTAGVRKVVGFDVVGFDIQGRITVKNDLYRVFSNAASGEGRHHVEAVIDTERGGVLFWRER
jgi:general secretion pathway protein K